MSLFDDAECNDFKKLTDGTCEYFSSDGSCSLPTRFTCALWIKYCDHPLVRDIFKSFRGSDVRIEKIIILNDSREIEDLFGKI